MTLRNFQPLLEAYATAVHDQDREQAFALLGQILSNLSILSAESHVRRVKDLLRLCRAGVVTPSTIAQFCDLTTVLPAPSTNTAPTDSDTTRSQRITFKELLDQSSIRLLTLDTPFDLDTFRVHGAKFADRLQADRVDRYLFAMLVSDVVDSSATKKLRGLKHFSASQLAIIYQHFSRQFGTFFIKE